MAATAHWANSASATLTRSRSFAHHTTGNNNKTGSGTRNVLRKELRTREIILLLLGHPSPQDTSFKTLPLRSVAFYIYGTDMNERLTINCTCPKGFYFPIIEKTTNKCHWIG